jgi:hypothetical protein
VVGYRRFRGVCWYPTASLSGVTTQNSTWIFTAVKISPLA